MLSDHASVILTNGIRQPPVNFIHLANIGLAKINCLGLLFILAEIDSHTDLICRGYCRLDRHYPFSKTCRIYLQSIHQGHEIVVRIVLETQHQSQKLWCDHTLHLWSPLVLFQVVPFQAAPLLLLPPDDVSFESWSSRLSFGQQIIISVFQPLQLW